MASPSSIAQPCEPNLAQAEAVLELHRLDRAMPGAALAVFDGAGTNHLETFLGDYDASTYVPIASATKTVSAAVIMSLVDDGTMSLDDQVADYLPHYLGTDAGEITVRQAFSQTSGLWNEAWPCVGDRDARLDECVLEILDDAPRISLPGATFFYGSNSMHVAGRLAEIAYCNRFGAECAGLESGAIWNKIFRERLRNPLGIGMFFNSNSNPRIDGGITSRLADYRTFWRMLINRGEVDGVRVLSPEAADEILSDQTRGAALYYSPAQPDFGYGLGMWRIYPDSEGNPRVLNDPGAFGFHPWYDLDTGLAGIVMIRDLAGASTGGGRQIALQIEQIVHDRFTESDADRDEDGICDGADVCPDAFDASQFDGDADGAGDACDLAPLDDRLWALPGETGRAIFYPDDACISVEYDPVGGAITCVPTENLLDWLQPESPGTVVTDLRYDVVRSADGSDFTSDTICEATSIPRAGPFNNAYMRDDPPAGGLHAYLARALSSAGSGPAGFSSAGDEIEARSCP